MGKNESGELGYRIVDCLCDLGNYVSSGLVVNVAKLVCTNPAGDSLWNLDSKWKSCYRELLVVEN